MIDRSRGSPAVKKMFAEFFDGVLVTDFWAVYKSAPDARWLAAETAVENILKRPHCAIVRRAARGSMHVSRG